MNQKVKDIVTTIVGFLVIVLEPINAYFTTQDFNWITFLSCVGLAIVAYFTGKNPKEKVNG